jgi:hypothetical protein
VLCDTVLLALDPIRGQIVPRVGRHALMGRNHVPLRSIDGRVACLI